MTSESRKTAQTCFQTVIVIQKSTIFGKLKPHTHICYIQYLTILNLTIHSFQNNYKVRLVTTKMVGDKT